MTFEIKSQSPLSSQGFTLLELLVSLGLIGIVMSAALSLNISANKATSALQARTDLTSETQIAQNYIAGKLRNAVFVYPYQSAGAVSYFTLASSGYSTFNPTARAGLAGTNNYNWRYSSADGADPFIAFVLPPTANPTTIASGDCDSATGSTKDQKCYSFYAYYAVPRSSLTTSTGVGTGASSVTIPSGANKLTTDPVNDAKVWAIMEYRAYFPSSTNGFSNSTSSGYPTGGTGRLVLDYVKPTSQSGTDKLFLAGPTVSTPSYPSASTVTINLATTRQVVAQTVNVPVTNRYGITVYPRNLQTALISN